MATILAVDDESRYRQELVMAITRDGHEVRTAGTGREAIDIGIQFRPDVLLIGNSTFDRSYEFQAMGVQHFLLKPYLINDLLDIVAGEK